MKKTIAILLFAFTAVAANAGVAKKSAHAAEAAAQASAHSAKKIAKASAHATKKAGHIAKKILY